MSKIYSRLALDDASGVSFLDRINGQAQFSDDSGATFKPLPGYSSGEARDMFVQRAQSIMPVGFHAFWADMALAATDLASGGFGPTSAAAVRNTGRAGGGKVNYTSSGASGNHFTTFNTQESAGVPIVTANISWEPWYVESEVRLNAITGSADLGICSVYNSAAGGIGATDASTVNYIALQFRPAINAGFLVITGWDGTTLNSYVTTIPVEVKQQRVYGLRNDGLGTLSVYRDGVLFPGTNGNGGYTMFNTVGMPVGAFARWERSNGGTTDIDVDSIGAAGMSR